jgi:hypothetical protein
MHTGKRIVFVLITWVLLLAVTETFLHYFTGRPSHVAFRMVAIPIYATDPVRITDQEDRLPAQDQSTLRGTIPTRLVAQTTRRLPEDPKPKDVFRIVSLGPSFAFGWGVNYEDSYIYQVAKALRVADKRIELVNVGTPSQPMSYQLRWLKRSGGYQPDLIIQTVYGDIPDIDPDDTLPEDQPYVKDGYLYFTKETSLRLWLKKIRLYSATLFYGWRLYATLSARVNANAPVVGDGKEFYRRSDLSENGIAGKTLVRYRAYMSFVHAAVANKPQIVFLYIPFAYVVRPADISRVAHHGTRIDPLYERAKSALLTRMLCGNGVNLIDTTAALVEGDKTKRMYNLYDVHFTPDGNRIAASYSAPLIQRILDEGWQASRPEQEAGAPKPFRPSQ